MDLENCHIEIEDQERNNKPTLEIRQDKVSPQILVESNNTKNTITGQTLFTGSDKQLMSPVNKAASSSLVGGVSRQQKLNISGVKSKSQISNSGLHHINKHVQRPIRTHELMTNQRVQKFNEANQKTPILLRRQKQQGISSVQNQKYRTSQDYEYFSQMAEMNMNMNMPSGLDLGRVTSNGDYRKYQVQSHGRDEQETQITTQINTQSQANVNNQGNSYAQYSFQQLQQVQNGIQRPQSQNYYNINKIKGNIAHQMKSGQVTCDPNTNQHSPLASQAGAYQIVQSGAVLQTHSNNNNSMRIGYHKRIKTAQGGQRIDLTNQNQQYRNEPIYNTIEPQPYYKSGRLQSDQSQFMNQGLVYGQYSNSLLSTKKKMALMNLKKNMTSFGGMTKQERQSDYVPENTSNTHVSQNQMQRSMLNSQLRHVDTSYTSQYEFTQKLPKKEQILYPSQFKSNVQCNIDIAGTMGREIPSKMVERNLTTKSGTLQNNMLTRIFSKTNYYKNEADNHSDGIILPQSFLNTLDQKTQQKLLKIQQKDPYLPYKKECLLVNICAVKTHFTVDMNTLNKQLHEENSISKQMTQKTLTNNGSLLVHVANLIPTPKITSPKGVVDDDSVTMPQWMFQELNLKHGDQICVTLDLMQADKSLRSQLKSGQYCIKTLTVEPLQTNYIEMAMGQQDPSIKIITVPDKSVESQANTVQSGERVSTKDSFEKSFGRNEDIIVERIRQSAFRYRVLKLGSVMKFFANQKVYEFQVDQINGIHHNSRDDEQLPFYCNFYDQKIAVEMHIGDFQASEKSFDQDKSESFTQSGVAGSKNRKKNGKDKNDGLDLDLIFEERGLDIYYMQKLIEQQQEALEAAKNNKKKISQTKKQTSSQVKKQGSIASKKNIQESHKRSSIASGSLSSKLSVSSPSPRSRRGASEEQSKNKYTSLQNRHSIRKQSGGDTQTSMQSNKSIKPENCPPQFLNAKLNNQNKTYTAASIQKSQHSLIGTLQSKQSRNSMSPSHNVQVITGGSLNATGNNDIIQIVIPVENEETQKLIERHASSPKNEEPFKQEQSECRIEDSKNVTPVRQNDNIDVTDQLEEKKAQETMLSFQYNLAFSNNKKNQRGNSIKYSPFYMEQQKTVDFHTCQVKNLKNLQEGGLLGQTNKSLIEQNDQRSPNGKKIEKKSPRDNHLLSGSTKQAQTLNLVLQGSNDFTQSPVKGPKEKSKERLSKEESNEKFKDFEYDLVNQKFIDAYKENIGQMYANDETSPQTKGTNLFEKIQEQKYEGLSGETSGLKSKWGPERGSTDFKDQFESINNQLSAQVIGDLSTAMFPRNESSVSPVGTKEALKIKAPSKIVVSNFFLGSGQIATSSKKSQSRSPVVTKFRRVPQRQDTEPIDVQLNYAAITDPTTLAKKNLNLQIEAESPVQIIKIQKNKDKFDDSSDQKYTSYGENETIRMGVRGKELNAKKSIHIPYGTITQNQKARRGSELDQLIGEPTEMMQGDHGDQSNYHADEFGHIRYGQVSIITSEGAQEFSNIDLKDFNEKRITNDNSKNTSVNDMNHMISANSLMTNMLMRLANKRLEMKLMGQKNLQTVHQARVNKNNSLHNYQGGPDSDKMTPFLNKHLKDKDAFNRAHSKFNTDVLRKTLDSNLTAKNPTIINTKSTKGKKDKYGNKEVMKKLHVPFEELKQDDLDMMPEVFTAIPHNKGAVEAMGEENQMFIKKFHEFHQQMLRLREVQLARQRVSGVSASADDNEEAYFQEFVNILEMAAQNDNGTQYLRKLEEFIQKQQNQDEWLARHLQNSMSNGEMSPVFGHHLENSKSIVSSVRNRKIVDLQNHKSKESGIDQSREKFNQIGKSGRIQSPKLYPKHIKTNMDQQIQLLSESQKDLVKNFTMNYQSPATAVHIVAQPQSATMKDTEIQIDGIDDENHTVIQNMSPVSLRKAIENSQGTRLSNTPDLSVRDSPAKQATKQIELRAAMQSLDNEQGPKDYLITLAKKESSEAHTSPKGLINLRQNSRINYKGSPDLSSNLDKGQISASKSMSKNPNIKNNLQISTSGHNSQDTNVKPNADLSTALKQGDKSLMFAKLQRSPVKAGEQQSPSPILIKKGLQPDDLPVIGASFDMMSPQTISVQQAGQQAQLTGTSLDQYSRKDGQTSKYKEIDRKSSPLASSVGYNDKLLRASLDSPLKNYENMNIKFNVVPAGPIYTVRATDSLGGKKGTNDSKSQTIQSQKQFSRQTTARERNKANVYLKTQPAPHPKTHKQAGWATVDQNKVLQIQKQNKDQLIQKSLTQNFDVKQKFELRHIPKNQPLYGAEKTDMGKLPSTYTISQPNSREPSIAVSTANIKQQQFSIENAGPSLSYIPTIAPSSKPLNTQKSHSKPIMSKDSKTFIPVTPPFVVHHVVKFDNLKDFRSKSRKKQLKLFKDQYPPDHSVHSPSIPSKNFNDTENKINTHSQGLKNMNINSRVDMPKQNNTYVTMKRGMKDYSTLNPTSDCVDMATSSPNFIITSFNASRQRSPANKRRIKKSMAEKGVSGNNVLSTSKSHMSHHLSPKSALSGMSNKNVSQNQDVELIIRQYSERRIKIENMNGDEDNADQNNTNTQALNSQIATSFSNQLPVSKRRSHQTSHNRQQQTLSGESRQILQAPIPTQYTNIVDQQNINFIDYQNGNGHNIQQINSGTINNEVLNTHGRVLQTSPDVSKQIYSTADVKITSQKQIQSQNTHQGNLRHILQSVNAKNRRAVSGISRKSGISGVSAQSRGSRSRDDDKLSPTGMIFVQSSKLNFVREDPGGEGGFTAKLSGPQSDQKIQK